MGQAVCAAAVADSDLELVAAIDASATGATVEGTDVRVGADISAAVNGRADVVVDFTVAAAARKNLPEVAAAGLHAVVGTTGLSPGDMADLESAFTNSNCVVAANFAISAVLMMRFAEIAAPFFDTAEIIEYHHNAKIDAPSGTALATAQRMADASSDWATDPTQHETVPGARGGSGPAGIRVHGVRMEGMLAHQDVILGAQGQTLTVRQDSYDRSSFMPGVVLACKRIAHHPGLTVGLDALLGV